MAGLKLTGLKKAYGDVQTLHGIDLEIADGEFMVFVGPSGCGKSTLLRSICGLEEISGGDLFIGKTRMNDVPPAKRGIAMVFQSYALYPHMSVAQNMAFGLKLAGMSKVQIADAVQRAAQILRIEPLLERKPKDLSGGQRQRVAIGRAIVRKPDVFLFDEPLSNLDASLRVQMRIELANLHRELRSTMIYVTHDQVEAMTLGTRIAVFNHGIVEQMGRPLDLYERPNKQFVASFLGSPTMNFLPCSATCAASGTQVDLGGGNGIAIPGEMKSGESGPFQLGIRPEHIEVVPAGQGLAAHIEFVEHLGDHQVVHSNLLHNQQRVVAKVPMSARVDESTELVGLRLDPRWCRLFSEDGRVVAAAV